MDGQLLTMVQVTAILGIIAPPILALVKRSQRLSDQAKDMLILVALVLVGGLAAFLCGDIDPLACSVVDLEGCIGLIVGYVSLVVGQAFAWYKMFYKPSGIDAKIAGK